VGTAKEEWPGAIGAERPLVTDAAADDFALPGKCAARQHNSRGRIPVVKHGHIARLVSRWAP
jgi:hypothetical protein